MLQKGTIFTILISYSSCISVLEFTKSIDTNVIFFSKYFNNSLTADKEGRIYLNVRKRLIPR